MKLNKNNIVLILGLFPVFILFNILILNFIPQNSVWFIVMLIMFMLINFFGIKKMRELPRKKEKYGALRKLELELPKEIKLDVYSSEKLGKYHMKSKLAEIYSPLILKGNNNNKIVISELLLKQDNLFQKITITREYLRQKTLSTIKMIIFLIMPVLLGMSIVLGLIMWYNNNNDPSMNPFLYSFYMPLLYTIAFLVHVFFWDRFLSREEHKIDKLLLNYFSAEEVISFMKKSEQLEGKGESEKQGKINDYHMNQRINKLKY